MFVFHRVKTRLVARTPYGPRVPVGGLPILTAVGRDRTYVIFIKPGRRKIRIYVEGKGLVCVNRKCVKSREWGRYATFALFSIGVIYVKLITNDFLVVKVEVLT